MRLVTVDAVVDAARQPAAYPPPPAPAPPSTSTPAVTIVGIPVHAITFEGLLAQIGEWVRAGDRAHHICTVNPEFVMVAQQDPIFRAILLRSDLNVADGVGLLWAAKRLGRALPERVTGSDGVPLIAERAAREGWRVFFLGAAEGVAERAAAVLTARHPALRVAGVYAGSPRPDEEDAIVERVNASGADVLFVAYGAPVQDQWIARNLPRLRVAMAMGVGGSFDFIAGIVPRAPVWMRRAGLEWLFRLVRQPWRARRMLRLPRFVWAVLRQKMTTTP
jgi:N-acetylglucosaminyldiphosphoundecaprenol N-acetyl-beta-D-mannosaminyltransferase